MSADPQSLGVSGFADPEGEAPHAVQLVARIERVDPPSVTAVYEAAGIAIVRLLADERAEPGGEWHPALSRWLAGRIRKLARRARGRDWERIQSIPGVTVGHAGAEFRALVPGPVDTVPTEVSKLQLQGFELTDDDRRSACDPEWARSGVVVAVNPGIEASIGKMTVQVAHASNMAWLEMPPSRRNAWQDAGFALAVIHPDGAGWAAFIADAPVLIRDAGFTEVPPGSATTAARWSATV